MNHLLDMSGFYFAKHQQLNLGSKDGLFTCGEDAYFVAKDASVMGVADGVSGWSAFNIGNSAYVAYQMEAIQKKFAESGMNDTASLVTQSFEELWNQYERKELRIPNGSATIIVAALHETHEGSPYLQYTNFGDCGLLILRNVQAPSNADEASHRTVISVQAVHASRRMYLPAEHTKAVPVPMQLCFYPAQGRRGAGSASQAALADTVNVTVQAGDIIIMASDGLWDNITADAIAQEVLLIFEKEVMAQTQAEKDQIVDTIPAYLSQRLVEKAHKANLKPDDITCVVGIVKHK